MFRIAILLILILWTKLSFGQVVNIENRRVKSDSSGWYSEFNTGFKYLKEVNPVFTFANDLRSQLKREKDLFLILGNYELSRSKGKTLTHNAFFHFRYNYKLTKYLRWEAFTQFQFNEITKVKNRFLLGTGPRWKLFDAGFGAMYIGNTYMFEVNRELKLDNTIRLQLDNRLSNYLSFSVFPLENVSIISTSYYQPVLNRWTDYRLSSVSDLRLKVNKYLFVQMSYRLSYDADPAEGIPPLNHSFENKLGIVF